MYEISSSLNLQDILHLLKDNESFILGKFVSEENIPARFLLKKFAVSLDKLMRENILRLALRNAKQTVEGVILVKRAEWDSEHFGLNIGKLELALFNSKLSPAHARASRQYLFQKIKKEAATQNLNVIFARIGLNQLLTIQSLEKEGAIITDVLLSFYINPKRGTKPVVSSSFAKVVEASKIDRQALREMSREIFKIDHFHADPYLPRNRCDELYAKWISNCLDGSVDKVLVAKKGAEVQGFITCRVEPIANGYSYGVIDLIGVKKEHMRKGIGFLLVGKALRYFSDFTRSVYVGTSATNIAATRLYQSMGFKQIFPEATLHLWVHTNRSSC